MENGRDEVGCVRFSFTGHPNEYAKQQQSEHAHALSRPLASGTEADWSVPWKRPAPADLSE